MSWIDLHIPEITRAVAGDSAALERIVAATQEPVYNLALRFLWHPHDAQDNTQEILIKVITNLSAFRGESAFGTWVYRIAVNHLLRARKSRAERREISFRAAAHTLAVQDTTPLTDDEADRVNDVKVACSHAMLLGLKRPYRMAFLLGAVIGLSGDEAARLLGISPASFRQRLSRSRGAMAEFLSRHCGLINADAPCHCRMRLRPCMANGSVAPYIALAANLRDNGGFHPAESALRREVATLEKVTLLYRSSGEYRVPESLERRIRGLFKSRLFPD